MTFDRNSTRLPIRTSLAEQVAALLRSEIGDREPGDRLPGMHELRKQYAVSINTVGMALALLEQDGVVIRRNGNGVFVADQAACHRIGILSELDLFDSRIGPQWRSMAGGLKSHLEAAGHAPQLYIGNAEPGYGATDEPSCPRFWEDAAAGKLDGAVILDVPSTPVWRQRINHLHIPTVGTLTGYEIVMDLPRMAEAAVRHLADLGCRCLGPIAWHGEASFRQAVADAGLTTCHDWIHADQDPALGGTGWEAFRDIWSARAGHPDGLVILDDVLFNDAQLAMLQLHVCVPQDLHLVTHSVRGISRPVRIPTARLEVDAAEGVNILANLLLARMRGEPVSPIRQRQSFRLVPAEDEHASNRKHETEGARI